MRPIGREGGGGIAQRGRSLISTIALLFVVVVHVLISHDTMSLSTGQKLKLRSHKSFHKVKIYHAPYSDHY